MGRGEPTGQKFAKPAPGRRVGGCAADDVDRAESRLLERAVWGVHRRSRDHVARTRGVDVRPAGGRRRGLDEIERIVI